MESFVQENVFRGKIIGLSMYEGEIEGRRVRREIIEHPGAAAILAIDHNNMLVMVNQHRFPLGRTLEIPAGTLEANELPLHCALRELEEETGYVAGSIKPLLSYYPSVGYNKEIIHCFVATDLRKTATNPDEDEILSVETHSMDAVMGMIASGRIRDSKTICSLFAYLNNTGRYNLSETV